MATRTSPSQPEMPLMRGGPRPASPVVRTADPAGSAMPDACRVVAALVAAAAKVPLETILAETRSRAPVAAARQLAMYLAHVALGLPQADVARAFHRDRSTVAHACRRVEDLRDDSGFDRSVAALERNARWAAGL